MKRLSALFLTLLLSGCSFSLPLTGDRDEVRYYVLTAPNPSGIEPAGGRLGVMPVSLPGYLSRPQLVVREDDGVNIAVSDFDRWGEELGRGVARVLCDTLSAEGISAVPLRTGVQVDAKLMLDIRRLDGSLGGDIVLDAVWTLQKGRTVYQSGRVLEKLPAGKSLRSMVEAQSALVQELARKIRRVVKPL